MSQKKFAEAEKWLLKGFEGIDSRKDQIPTEQQFRRFNAIDRLVTLYQAIDNSVALKKWLEEKVRFGSPPTNTIEIF